MASSGDNALDIQNHDDGSSAPEGKDITATRSSTIVNAVAMEISIIITIILQFFLGSSLIIFVRFISNNLEQ